jgi:glycosyltransferase involved in cell wall biosynthesis
MLRTTVMTTRVKIIIPALNEEQSVGRVLQDIPSQGPGFVIEEVIVVDNGSTDHTAHIAADHGATVVAEPVRGYGKACLTGLLIAARTPPDVILFLDADYSDDPTEVGKVLQPILKNQYDLVIGTRTAGLARPGSLTPHQKFGNWLSCELVEKIYGIKYTDLGPFRAVTWDALKKINMQDENFGWTIEMQVKAAKLNLKITEVPVSYRPRIGQSKISGTLKGSFMAGSIILSTIFKQTSLGKRLHFS